MNQHLDLLRYRVGRVLLMSLEDLPSNPKTLPTCPHDVLFFEMSLFAESAH